MPFNRLTIALLALTALCVSACATSRMARSEVRSKTEEVRSDTLREQVTVVVMDTVKEVTTITVRESESGDTLRMTTITDRSRASTKDRYHDVKEKVLVKTDTVYVEREANKTVAVASPGATIDSEGNIKPQPSYIKLLKWLCFVILALTAFIIVIRIFILKR